MLLLLSVKCGLTISGASLTACCLEEQHNLEIFKVWQVISITIRLTKS